MKRFVIIFVCIVLLISLCVPVFADTVLEPDYPADDIPSGDGQVYTEFLYSVGTTGGGDKLTVGSLCLLTAIIYNAWVEPEYPSFIECYNLSSSVWLRCSGYTMWWLVDTAPKLFTTTVKIPSVVVTTINHYLDLEGANFHIPSDVYAIEEIRDYVAVNNIKSQNRFFLNKEEYVKTTPEGIAESAVNVLTAGIFEGVDKVLESILGEDYDKGTLWNYNDPLIKQHAVIFNWEFSQTQDKEDNLEEMTTEHMYQGAYYLTTALDLIASYASSFAFIGYIFGLFSNLGFFTVILYVSLGVGCLSFMLSITEIIAKESYSRSRYHGKYER